VDGRNQEILHHLGWLNPLVGNGWEWGNGIIIDSYCESFPHSLLSTSKLKSINNDKRPIKLSTGSGFPPSTDIAAPNWLQELEVIADRRGEFPNCWGTPIAGWFSIYENWLVVWNIFYFP